MILNEEAEIARIKKIVESIFGKNVLPKSKIKKAIRHFKDGDYYDLRVDPGDPLIMDWYHLLVMFVAFEGNLDQRSVFYHTMRKIPDDLESSYFLVSGTNFLLNHLAKLKFEEYHIEAIQRMAEEIDVDLPDDFIEYLREFQFKADVMIVPEGSVMHPREPFVKVTGTFAEALFVESLVISTLTFMTGVATKTSGVITEAGDIPVFGFDLRRSPNIFASWATLVAGCAGTSNMKAAQVFGAKITGTMMHAFIMLIGNELLAFYLFWLITKSAVFLIDTINTMQGAINAIEIAKIINEKIAVRLDSGDLIDLIHKISVLDSEDWIDTIVLTNDLNRMKIRAITEALVRLGIKKKIVIGIGTNLVNINPIASVYKITAVQEDGFFRSCIKLSDDVEKENLQGDIEVWREYQNGKAIRDVISLANEGSPGVNFRRIMILAMKEGELIVNLPELAEIQAFAKLNVEALPDIYRKGDSSVNFPVSLNEGAKKLKEEARKEAMTFDEEIRERTLAMIREMERQRRETVETKNGGR